MGEACSDISNLPPLLLATAACIGPGAALIQCTLGLGIASPAMHQTDA